MMLLKPSSGPWCSENKDRIILEQTTFIRIEMFRHKTKEDQSNAFALINSVSSLRRQVNLNYAIKVSPTA